MRRDYKQEQEYIGWLKSIDCIVYSPFDGDMLNYIDGSEWYQLDSTKSSSSRSYAQLAFNAQEHCLDITFRGNVTNNSTSIIQIDRSVYSDATIGVKVSNYNCTVIGTSCLKSTTGTINGNGRWSNVPATGGISPSGNAWFTEGNQNNNLGLWLCAYSTNGYTTYPPNSFTWIGGVHDSADGNLSIKYKNGVFNMNHTVNDSFRVVNQNNKTYSCVALDQTNNQTAIYQVRDVYFFKRALTAEQMFKIYQHDQQ